MGVMTTFSFGFQRLNSINEYDSQIDNIIFLAFSIIVYIFGLMGNGIFLWLLTCSIKRNAFTTYLLNLSISSSGLLVVILCGYANTIAGSVDEDFDNYHIVYAILINLFILMLSNDHLILTAIGIDRCASVLFPNWYRCQKSSNFPTLVCSLIWVFFFIIFIMELTVLIDEGYFIEIYTLYCFAGTSLIFLAVVTICTLTLFVRVCLKLQRQQHGALLTVILLTLPLFVLVEAFTIAAMLDVHFEMFHILLGHSLVRIINPLVYFLVGRWKASQLQESMLVILQRVFKDEQPSLPKHNQLQPLH